MPNVPASDPGDTVNGERPYLNRPVLDAILEERRYQDWKWGDDSPPAERGHTLAEWAGILGREFGEATTALVDDHFRRAGEVNVVQRRSVYMAQRAELIQVAAVAVAIVEVLDEEQRDLGARTPPAPLLVTHTPVLVRWICPGCYRELSAVVREDDERTWPALLCPDCQRGES